MTNANLGVCGQVLEYQYPDGVTGMLKAQTYKYHHRRRLAEYLLTTILFIVFFCEARVITVRFAAVCTFTTMAEEDKRPVFFFDIDNCVRLSLLECRAFANHCLLALFKELVCIVRKKGTLLTVLHRQECS